MLSNNEQFRGKPTWVVTGTTMLNSYSPVELTTYSDGEILFWEPRSNVSVCLSVEDVAKLRNALNSMQPPVVIEQRNSDVKNYVKDVSNAPKLSVYKHNLDDVAIPTAKYESGIVDTLAEVKDLDVKDLDVTDSEVKEVKRKKLAKNVKPVVIPAVKPTVKLTVKSMVKANVTSKGNPNVKGTSISSNVLSSRSGISKGQIPQDIVSASFKEQMKSIMTAPKGNTFVKDTASDIEVKITSAKSTGDTVKVITPSVAVVKDTSKFERKVLREDLGWGANVSKTDRYYYSTRDAARLAVIAHTVGTNGRVA